MKPTARKSILNTVKIALFAAIISVSAMIAIPFPVPLTLQTFGVFAALFVLGGKCGSISVLLYIAIGAVGLPVFSGFTGGIGRLFDLTGGFIWGFLVAALAFWALEALTGKKRFFLPIATAISLALTYTAGCIQFAAVSSADGAEVGFFSALVGCVLPFVLPDVIKIFLAYIISRRIRKFTE